ncbi:hypothetical protein ACHAXR_008290 [Thalassiosira sp. AJA248-18]
MARTRIGPDGNVIKDGEESSSGGDGGGGGRRRWCRLPHRVDTFGFRLELKHFAIVLLLISMTMGTLGLGLFIISLSIYTRYQRYSSGDGGSGSGGASRWKNGKAVGSNIKGVGDLPKAPKGG